MSLHCNAFASFTQCIVGEPSPPHTHVLEPLAFYQTLHVCTSECENGASATFGWETQTISLYQTVSLCCIPGTQWGKGYHTKGHSGGRIPHQETQWGKGYHTKRHSRGKNTTPRDTLLQYFVLDDILLNSQKKL